MIGKWSMFLEMNVGKDQERKEMNLALVSA